VAIYAKMLTCMDKVLLKDETKNIY